MKLLQLALVIDRTFKANPSDAGLDVVILVKDSSTVGVYPNVKVIQLIRDLIGKVVCSVSTRHIL